MNVSKNSSRLINLNDGSQLDAFGILKTANRQNIFDIQFTYDLQPLIFEPVITDPGSSTITHDTTNRRASINFTNTPTEKNCYLQSFQYLRYQPGKGQEISIVFNFGAAVSGVTCFAQYGDADNAFRFSQAGTGILSLSILSNTTSGDQIIAQSSWNLDKLDGTGASAKTLDITKLQLFIIDFQAYTGRVRMGFNIGGNIIYAHEFLNSNTIAYPYIQSANLPIAVGMTSTSTGVTKTMFFNSGSVISSGGQDENIGYEFSVESAANLVAASGARTHAISLRPKPTFNSIVNRIEIHQIEISIMATGVNPVLWELVLGQATTTPTYTDANATYSSASFDVAGTISGSPAIVVDSGYVVASGASKSNADLPITSRYPITLNAAGAVRALGTASVLVTGIGGASACRVLFKFKEIR